MSNDRLPSAVNLLQNPGSSAWTDSPLALSPQPTSKLKTAESKDASRQQSPADKTVDVTLPNGTASADIDTPMSDSSDELEIVEVREVKRSTQSQTLRSKVSSTRSRISVTGINAQIAHNNVKKPVQKRESFDMNLIDPALRDVGIPIKAASPVPSSVHKESETQAIGTKRTADFGADGKPKRIRASQSISSPTELSCSVPEASSSQPSSQDSGYQSILPSSVILTAPDNIPRWLPNTWSKRDYINLVSAVERTFNFERYARYVGRHPHEISQVFRGIVITPILDNVDSIFPTQFKSKLTKETEDLIKSPSEQQNIAEVRMSSYANAEKQLSAALAEESNKQLKILKAQALSDIGAELRLQIEADIKTQLQTEGWVQLNKAKDLIGQYEREIQETKPDVSSGSDADSKKGKLKIKPIAEAQKDLLAASIMFEKARKADERRLKLAEREAKGAGEGKKLGRPPKKGDSKGKGADFV